MIVGHIVNHKRSDIPMENILMVGDFIIITMYLIGAWRCASEVVLIDPDVYTESEAGQVSEKEGQYAWDYVDSVVTKKMSEDPKITLYSEEYRSRSEERCVGKECRSRWSPYH